MPCLFLRILKIISSRVYRFIHHLMTSCEISLMIHTKISNYIILWHCCEKTNVNEVRRLICKKAAKIFGRCQPYIWIDITDILDKREDTKTCTIAIKLLETDFASGHTLTPRRFFQSMRSDIPATSIISPWAHLVEHRRVKKLMVLSMNPFLMFIRWTYDA